jgi:mersacidin/lichenicidin family type 2 lantibiotic
MSTEQIIRAWKDEAYRKSLSEVERAQLPEHPAGLVELTDEQMESVAGGTTGNWCSYWFRCGTNKILG